MHDEKRPGDVLKVPGDPLDDVADDVRYGIYTFIISRKGSSTGNFLELERAFERDGIVNASS